MKNAIRTFALVLALSGAVAGFASSHSAKTLQPEQVATLGHQVILSAMPAPACTPSTCNIRGGSN